MKSIFARNVFTKFVFRRRSQMNIRFQIKIPYFRWKKSDAFVINKYYYKVDLKFYKSLYPTKQAINLKNPMTKKIMIIRTSSS